MRLSLFVRVSNVHRGTFELQEDRLRNPDAPGVLVKECGLEDVRMLSVVQPFIDMMHLLSNICLNTNAQVVVRLWLHTIFL